MTGITGVLDVGAEAVVVASGRFGRDDRTLEASWKASLESGVRWVDFGVDGYADRIRGVPFMAYSSRSLWTLGGVEGMEEAARLPRANSSR